MSELMIRDSDRLSSDIKLAGIRIFTGLLVILLKWLTVYQSVALLSVFSLFVLTAIPMISGISSEGEEFKSISLYPVVVLFAVALFGKMGGMMHVAAAVWCIMAFGEGVHSIVSILAGDKARISWNSEQSWYGMAALFFAGIFSSMVAAHWVWSGTHSDRPGSELELIMVTIASTTAYTLARSIGSRFIEKNVMLPMLYGVLLYVLFLVDLENLMVNLTGRIPEFFTLSIVSGGLIVLIRRKCELSNRTAGLLWLLSTGMGVFGGWLLVLLLCLFWSAAFVIDVDEGKSPYILSGTAAVICAFLACSTSVRSQSHLAGPYHNFIFGSVVALAAGSGRLAGRLSMKIVGKTSFSITSLRRKDDTVSGHMDSLIIEDFIGSMLGALILGMVAAIMGILNSYHEILVIPFSLAVARLGAGYIFAAIPRFFESEFPVELIGSVLFATGILVTLL